MVNQMEMMRCDAISGVKAVHRFAGCGVGFGGLAACRPFENGSRNWTIHTWVDMQGAREAMSELQITASGLVFDHAPCRNKACCFGHKKADLGKLLRRGANVS
jgi:hypothetical protein